MNRTTHISIAFLATLALGLAPPSAAAGRTVTILHVSDTHSHLDATGPRDAALRGTVGGIAKASTVIARARAEDPDALLLHAGDLFQGDLFFNFAFGVPELQWMVATGFDAMTVGNHEFDFGPENLMGILATAFAEGSFPMLSANAGGLEPVGLAPFVRPSIVKNAGGVQVGIFGLTVPDDPLCQNGAVTLDVDLPAVAAREVASMKAAGAEVIVLLSHLGLARDAELAAVVGGIDVIIGAHDHVTLEEPIDVPGPDGRMTILVEAGPYYAHIGRVRLEVAPEGVHLAGYELLRVDASVPPDPEVEGLVDQLKGAIESALGPVFSSSIGHARRDLAAVSSRGPFRDSPVGNLVTDAFRAAGQTDVALTTAGLLSEGISEGPLVPADLFRVVSYGFDSTTGLGFGLVTFDISAPELVKALEIAVAGSGVEDPFFPQVSGMSFLYSSGRAPGERVYAVSIRIGRHGIDPARTYSVTADAALASFLPVLGVEITNVKPLASVFEYTALYGYVQGDEGALNQRAEGRIKDLASMDQSL